MLEPWQPCKIDLGLLFRADTITAQERLYLQMADFCVLCGGRQHLAPLQATLQAADSQSDVSRSECLLPLRSESSIEWLVQLCCSQPDFGVLGPIPKGGWL